MSPLPLVLLSSRDLPDLIRTAGERVLFRFLEFFSAHLRNPHTRAAYGRAIKSFCSWCDSRRVSLEQLNSVLLAAWVESLRLEHGYSIPTQKQHLAAVRMLLDYLVSGGVLPSNPASAVRGPRYRIRRGRTPVLSAAEARQLLDTMDTSTLAGLRDRALVGVMVYTFARVSAVLALRIEDYFPSGKRSKVRLLEKGGQYLEVFLHHNAEQYLDAYFTAARLDQASPREPLFRSLDRKGQLSCRPLGRTDALRRVKHWAQRAGLNPAICNHTFRATGITTYLRNGGRLEIAQQLAGHASARTTGLYDRREDEVSLDEIERIHI